MAHRCTTTGLVRCPRTQTTKAAQTGVRGALRTKLLFIATMTAMVYPQARALAQNVASSAATQTYNIAAGPLSPALSSFAGQAGVNLSSNPALTEGLRTAGLHGRFGVTDGFAQLLANTNVEAVSRGNGVYVLRAIPASATTMAPVTVTGAHANRATTEGTGSFTTRASASATGMSLSLRETPQSVSVMTRQRMEDQNLNSLDEVLSNTTGVYVFGEDTDRTDFYSRGFYINNVQYDGVPTSIGLSMFGESSNDSIIYDRIEVVRGATGLMTGPGNPSASINLVRKRANSKELTGTVALGAGSWNQYRASVDLSTPINSDGSVRGRVIAMGQQKDSYMDLYHAKKQVFYGVIDADLGANTTLSVGADYQQNRPDGSTWGGLPAIFSDGTPTNWRTSKTTAADWTRWDTTNTTVFSTLEHRFESGWNARANFMHRESKYDAKLLYLYGAPDRITGKGMGTLPGYFNSNFKQDTLDVQATGPFDLFGRKHEMVVGLTGSRSTQRDYNHTRDSVSPGVGNFYDWDGSYPEPVWGKQNLTVRDKIEQRAVYTAGRFSLADPLTLIVGGRYTDWKSDALTQKRDEQVFTPYAGLVYDINETYSAYASYTDIFLPQSNRDRTGKYLDPVTGKNYELGIKGEYLEGRVNASLAVFTVKQNNVAQADSGFFVPGTTDQAYTAAQGVTTRGIEGEVSGQITPGWNMTLGATLTSSKDADRDTVNTDTPRAFVRLFTTYRLPGQFDKLTVGGGVNWQSSTYKLHDTDTKSVRVKQNAFSLVNLMARYEFNPSLSAQLNVNNVFNKQYATNLSQLYFGAPRNVFLSMNAKF